MKENSLCSTWFHLLVPGGKMADRQTSFCRPNHLPAPMAGATDRLAAGLAAPGAFVLDQVVIKAGKAAEAPATGRAVVPWLEFVIVAEHGRL